MSRWFTQAQTDTLRDEVYSQGRAHAITGGAVLTQRRIDRVRVMIASQVTQSGEYRMTPGQLETAVDGYTEGYSLGLEEFAQLYDDTEDDDS